MGGLAVPRPLGSVPPSLLFYAAQTVPDNGRASVFARLSLPAPAQVFPEPRHLTVRHGPPYNDSTGCRTLVEGTAAMPAPLLQSHVPGHPCRRGKVRDVYDLGDRLVIVATDRISAFDWVLPTPIPDKGRVLTALSLFWFDFLGVPNHLLGTDVTAMPPEFAARADELAGRTVLVRKARVVPVECVVR